ncbi:hypothetical protein E0W68_00515 [Flavobacterium salilacus subsp. salilacus]|uniref:hypothetical protein n=1 Tax=Flavobacterium TaxID=237 RepID=UPI001074E66D|nr:MULTISPECIES: hypothetical protein [Flavobacterium]KAF2519751.1 hypothetical protein E0W68_00515 [Flavobacterium salilacus subsp. salilacus]MBE1614357.1 hypothetical protein [Flavobacterium sp. SaA2.13]
MPKPTITKPYKDIAGLHADDNKNLIEFINANSADFDSIKYLLAFADDVEITRETACKALLKYMLVERCYFDGEEAGNELQRTNTKAKYGLFDFDYNLPDVAGEYDEKKFALMDTVVTHTCSPESKCSSCNGNGVCNTCRGKRSKVCTHCRGTGLKKRKPGPKSDLDILMGDNCFWCSGDGHIDCSSCNGMGQCTGCAGMGRIICPKCDGTSYYQTFKGYRTAFKNYTKDYYFVNDSNLIDALKKTENTSFFDDDLVEWSKEDEIIYDNRDSLISENEYVKDVFNELDDFTKQYKNTRLGRVSSSLENVPITKVSFSFEGKPYTLYVLGENNICYYTELPKSHTYKQGWFSRLISNFTKKSRQAAFMYIAGYMFRADNETQAAEKELFDNLLDEMKISKSKKEKVTSGLTRTYSLDEIRPYIKGVRKDRRSLIFAWHCAISNKEATAEEEKAFKKLAELFKVSEEEVKTIQHKAQQFSGLTNEQMLDEYFR